MNKKVLNMKIFTALCALILILSPVFHSKSHNNKIVLSSNKTKQSTSTATTTDQECSSTIYFINTFQKADNQLYNLSNRFIAHKSLYDELLHKYEQEGKTEEVDKIKKKQADIQNFYIEKIEEIRTYMNNITNEIQEQLTEDCRAKLKSYTDTMNEHIHSALEKITIKN